MNNKILNFSVVAVLVIFSSVSIVNFIDNINNQNENNEDIQKNVYFYDLEPAKEKCFEGEERERIENVYIEYTRITGIKNLSKFYVYDRVCYF